MTPGTTGNKILEDNTDTMRMLKDLKFINKISFSSTITTKPKPKERKLSKSELMNTWT